MPPEWLASTVLSVVIDRSGIDPMPIEDVAIARVDGGVTSAPELRRLAASVLGGLSPCRGFPPDRSGGSGL
ncbi:hypothetical protein [Nocardia sp. NPDC051463]|uniref:hypothetical protein n=1 Tax=Nocardia sp. NPDC051463 TaxID=3154845 RepID=UPI00344DE911